MTARDFRRIALSFDGVEERQHGGEPTFLVGGRRFAGLASIAQGYGNLTLTPEVQAEFVAERPDLFVPIAWCKEYGDGKVFHMSLGHNEAVWADERYQQSLLGGIKWILGLEKGDATPNPEIEARETPKGQGAIEAATKAAEAKSE